jgi:predicted O-methyltransferase YrrM
LLAVLLLESSCDSDQPATQVATSVSPSVLEIDKRREAVVSRVKQRYREFGVVVEPANWPATGGNYAPNQITDIETGRRLNIGLGFHDTDIELFLKISEKLRAKSIFIIGNAFGYSTFVLSEIFTDAVVDAIDAEVEGLDNKRGSELTRLIASKYYPNVRLTIGFSPQDLAKAVRPGLMRDLRGYDLVFVDGLHTDEQQLKDFRGMVPYLSDRTVVVFHDVGLQNMRDSLKIIQKEARGLGFDTFIETAKSTVYGAGVIGRGVDSLEEHLGTLLPVVDRFVWEGKKFRISQLNAWFWSLDTDRSGEISKQEYTAEDAAMMMQRGRAFDWMLKLADDDHDGALTVVECRDAFGVKDSRRRVAKLFQRLDQDRDGIITMEEIAHIPGQTKKVLERDIEFLYRLGDIGEDRRVPLETFLKVFARKSSVER